MPKRFTLSFAVAFVGAVLVTAAEDGRTFEEKAERAIIADQANAPGAKCPLSRLQIDKADLGLLRVCLTYGLTAYEAAQRYPVSAAKVFAVYGQEEAFQKILDQYGHQVIPVVAYFVENGSLKFQVRQALGEILDQVWAGERPKWELAKLTREQIGLIAIYEIATRGHEILAEFEIVDGIAKPKPVTGLILETKQFLLGGLGDLEKVLVRGERLPTWNEVGLAGLDFTIIVGGVGAVAKATRLGEEALVEKGTGRLMAEGAYKSVSIAGKTVAQIAPYAPLAFMYFVVTRPRLIPYFGGWVAEQFGVNRYVGICAVYFGAILLFLGFLRRLVWYGQVVSRSFGGLRVRFARRPGSYLRSQSLINASTARPR
jgi:hypothetical protein